ncbi:MAG: MarR family transcriptional regulator [Geodermatophilaceae bacterium]|nr:MarR family transcriptional regulator [Geodermatophilaceae bacterium]
MTVTIDDNHAPCVGCRCVSKQQPSSYAESLAFLLSQVGARSAQIFAERLAALGVSPRAYGVLSNLVNPASRTQQQLADTLGIHRNNMVTLIDELETAGWLRRHRSVQDRRAFDIRLTRTGRTLVARVDKFMPALEDEVGHGLSESDRQTLVGLLRQVAQQLDLTPGVHPYLRLPSR